MPRTASNFGLTHTALNGARARMGRMPAPFSRKAEVGTVFALRPEEEVAQPVVRTARQAASDMDETKVIFMARG